MVVKRRALVSRGHSVCASRVSGKRPVPAGRSFRVDCNSAQYPSNEGAASPREFALERARPVNRSAHTGRWPVATQEAFRIATIDRIGTIAWSVPASVLSVLSLPERCADCRNCSVHSETGKFAACDGVRNCKTPAQRPVGAGYFPYPASSLLDPEKSSETVVPDFIEASVQTITDA